MNTLAQVGVHYDYILQHYDEGQILGVFLYGSQNYNTDLDNSDVDTKAIYIPTFDEILFEKPLSKELHLPNGEHCEVKDIREMVVNFKKQNINFLEILFTEYYIINPKYKEPWEKCFIKYRESIARYDMTKAIRSAAYQASHTLSQDPTNGKKISNALRILLYIQKYLYNDKYLDCIRLSSEHTDFLKSLKRNEIKEVSSLVEFLKVSLNEYRNFENGELLRFQNDINFIMQEGCKELIKLNIKGDLKNE